MTGRPNIASLASLIGDPSRAIMLQTLMDGRARTAGELALEAGVTPPTASGHLAKLVDGALLAVAHQGRHRYFRIASTEAAEAIEALSTFAARQHVPRTPRFPKGERMRNARTCYDHLAGRLGIALADALLEGGRLTLADGSFRITEAGDREFRAFGIDMEGLRAAKRPVLRTCLDWSERRPHLAGGLGAALYARFQDLRWIERAADRTVAVTRKGEAGFRERFGMAAV